MYVFDASDSISYIYLALSTLFHVLFYYYIEHVIIFLRNFNRRNAANVSYAKSHSLENPKVDRYGNEVMTSNFCVRRAIRTTLDPSCTDSRSSESGNQLTNNNKITAVFQI